MLTPNDSLDKSLYFSRQHFGNGLSSSSFIIQSGTDLCVGDISNIVQLSNMVAKGSTVVVIIVWYGNHCIGTTLVWKGIEMLKAKSLA